MNFHPTRIKYKSTHHKFISFIAFTIHCTLTVTFDVNPQVITYLLLQVLSATSLTGLLEKLQNCNELLDKIMKGLNAYLEKKRLFFPRYTACSLFDACSTV